MQKCNYVCSHFPALVSRKFLKFKSITTAQELEHTKVLQRREHKPISNPFKSELRLLAFKHWFVSAPSVKCRLMMTTEVPERPVVNVMERLRRANALLEDDDPRILLAVVITFIFF
jgi:hypothetical protein